MREQTPPRLENEILDRPHGVIDLDQDRETDFEEALARQILLKAEFHENPTQTEYPSDFRLRMKYLHEELESLSTENPEAIRFGPDYRMVTAKGTPLFFETIFYDHEPSLNRQARTYHILALDSDGNILGIRSTRIDEHGFPGRRYASARGLLITGARHSGIGLPLETVHLDLLQREADRLNMRVDWHVENFNGESLDKLLALYAQTHESSLVPLIRNLEQDQTGWQVLYGSKGKLGIDLHGQRSFSPHGNFEDLEQIEEIALLRVSQRTEGQIVSQSHLTKDERANHRQKKLTRFQSLMQQMEQIGETAPSINYASSS